MSERPPPDIPRMWVLVAAINAKLNAERAEREQKDEHERKDATKGPSLDV